MLELRQYAGTNPASSGVSYVNGKCSLSRHNNLPNFCVEEKSGCFINKLHHIWTENMPVSKCILF